MERDEYSSAELCDIASAAPVDTIEETIEALTQKQISEAQMEFYEYVHMCVARVDFYVTGAMQVYKLCDRKEAEQVVWGQLDRCFAHRRAVLTQAIQALHGLADYRKEGFKSWQERQP